LGRSVELSEKAAQKLAGIKRWYSQPGAGRAAARRIQAIVAAIECLEFFPFMGRPGDTPGTRELTAQEHRIVYEVAEGDDTPETAGDIVVLNILGPGEP
jgi:plasmid stabilization system protein ParE